MVNYFMIYLLPLKWFLMSEQIELLAPASFIDIVVSCIPLIIPVLLAVFFNLEGGEIAKGKRGLSEEKIKTGKLLVRIITKFAIALVVLNLIYETVAYIYLDIKKEQGDFETLTGEISYFIDTNSGRDFILNDVRFMISDYDSFCFRNIEEVSRNREIKLDYIRVGFFPFWRRCVLKIKYTD